MPCVDKLRKENKLVEVISIYSVVLLLLYCYANPVRSTATATWMKSTTMSKTRSRYVCFRVVGNNQIEDYDNIL